MTQQLCLSMLVMLILPPLYCTLRIEATHYSFIIDWIHFYYFFVDGGQDHLVSPAQLLPGGLTARLPAQSGTSNNDKTC